MANDLYVVRNVFTRAGSANLWYVSRSTSLKKVAALMGGFLMLSRFSPASSNTMFLSESGSENLAKEMEI